MLDDSHIAKLKKVRNIIPVISIEGFENETDFRRGEGVYARLSGVMKNFEKAKLFWGISLTANRKNFNTITGDNFINELTDSGARLFFFVEYVPIEERTENLVLTKAQQERLNDLTGELKTKFPGLFISLPGDEEEYGGCLAAGRGFIHISPGGNLEPCPFAPFSDINVTDISLKEALKSDFLRNIRESHHLLSENDGGCALWTNRDWVRTLL
jgi:MoaA/NifB/PqqE/SkfB family radical SAM enzyme